MIIKGQQVRIKLGGKVLACATQCSCHISAQLEEASHKDTNNGLWSEQDVVGLGWDFSADALAYAGDEGGTTIDGKTYEDIPDLVGTKVEVEFVQDGTKALRHGTAIINDYNETWQTKTNGSYSVQGTGSGPLVKGAKA